MLYIASDHRGFELKRKIKASLESAGYAVKDMGAREYDPDDDYPDFIVPAARAVAADPKNSQAVILGYSGQGEAMAANRFAGVRAAVYYGGPRELLALSRGHNNANVLSLGAGFLGETDALEAVRAWLAAPFSKEERHVRRINKIDSAGTDG